MHFWPSICIAFPLPQMCVNQVCTAVSSLHSPACQCHGNGVCNNRGHCHCHQGFAPPDCLYPGSGGSIDSGPASNPNGENVFFSFPFTVFFSFPSLFFFSFLKEAFFPQNLLVTCYSHL